MTAKNNNRFNTFEHFFLFKSLEFQIKIIRAVNFIIKLLTEESMCNEKKHNRVSSIVEFQVRSLV